MPQRRILVLDIETAPNLDKILEVFPSLSDYPGKTMKATINTIICFGYKWHGEMDKAECINVWDLADSINDDKKICLEIQKLVEQADAIVTHNGRRFDWKFIQTRFLLHKIRPLPKIPHIDTCQIAKSNLFAYNNRLNTLGELTGRGQKLENGGWDLWVRVVRGEKKARKLMTEYCKQDVDLLDGIFKDLMPFAPNIPNANLYRNHEKDCCPYCESTRIHGHGYRQTKTNSFQRFLCKDCSSTFSRPSERSILRSY